MEAHGNLLELTISTVAILAKEANSWKLALRMVIGYLCLAWLAAWATFQITGFLV